MSIFSTVLDKISPHDHPANTASASTTLPRPRLRRHRVAQLSRPLLRQLHQRLRRRLSDPPSSRCPPVDVEAVLTKMQEAGRHQMNWRSSIVDLLKLLGFDSSLEARAVTSSQIRRKSPRVGQRGWRPATTASLPGAFHGALVHLRHSRPFCCKGRTTAAIGFACRHDGEHGRAVDAARALLVRWRLRGLFAAHGRQLDSGGTRIAKHRPLWPVQWAIYCGASHESPLLARQERCARR
ncbi:DUF3597 family protein [Paraburkholderia youngii]|uniref:DUF3597 family protein n=1 Tax=Paraburkholderia youngii TaxID=2782701 RepID=UPI0015923881|nr:DUF3597 domain-containing protein [Paraburkholderia youngii]